MVVVGLAHRAVRCHLRDLCLGTKPETPIALLLYLCNNDLLLRELPEDGLSLSSAFLGKFGDYKLWLHDTVRQPKWTLPNVDGRRPDGLARLQPLLQDQEDIGDIRLGSALDATTHAGSRTLLRVLSRMVKNCYWNAQFQSDPVWHVSRSMACLILLRHTL